MKKASILSAAMGLAFIGAASAANVTVYYSPTCPHCHHARDFINNTLAKEYPTVTVTEINVMEEGNLSEFRATLEKCGFKSGGVPVIVIGDNCEQGYADFMQDALRRHVEADLANDSETAAATDSVVDATPDNTDTVATDNATPQPDADASADAVVTDSAKGGNAKIWFWGLLIVLVAGLGLALIKKGKHN